MRGVTVSLDDYNFKSETILRLQEEKKLLLKALKTLRNYEYEPYAQHTDECSYYRDGLGACSCPLPAIDVIIAYSEKGNE